MAFIKAHKKALALGLLLLAAVIFAVLCPQTHTVQARSLTELGLTLTIPQEPYFDEDYHNFGLQPLNRLVIYFPGYAEKPSSGIMRLEWEPGDFEDLPVPLEVVEILVPQPIESASCPVLMLQGYYKAHLRRPGARVELQGRLYRPGRLREYIFWENEDIVLYDIQALLYPTAEEMIVDFHAKQLQGPQDPNFNMDYDHGYLLEVAAYTRANGSLWIAPIPPKTVLLKLAENIPPRRLGYPFLR